MKELVDGHVLIVFGISGRDSLINEFMLKLDPRTRVLILMSEQTKEITRMHFVPSNRRSLTTL